MAENVALDVAFWILAVLTVGAALAVVLLQNVFRAALFLVLCFFTTAGIYVTLNADFLAAVQVLVYIGAIGVLLIFGILFTRDAQRGSLFNRLRLPALLFSAALLGVMIFTMVGTDWAAEAVGNPALTALTNSAGSGVTESLGQALFSKDGYILPVEIAGVMLLAAVLGGIVIMREK